jgi:hypothetical protein
VRSGFQRSPTENWSEQLSQLMNGFFRAAVVSGEDSTQASYSA